jgi:hypothetical protein
MERVGAPALSRLVRPTPVEEFADSIWGRRPHLATVEERGGDTFADVFSLDAVDELVSERGLRTPFLRVAKDGSTLADRTFTAGGGIGAGIADQVSEDKLLHLFDEGATVVLQGLHRTWAPVRELSQALAADLGHPVQVNAYITPPQNQGFADHYDVHDVFVLQVHGQKRWALREPVHPVPLRDEPWTDHREAVEERSRQAAYLDTTLRPGDCLYLPRGWIHSARALGGVTAHLTFGVHAWTRHHLAEILLDRAGAQLPHAEQVRASLPVGVDPTDIESLTEDVEVARGALLDAIRRLPVADVAEALRGRSRAAQRPASIAPLAQLAAAEHLSGVSVLRQREHLMLDVLPGPDGQVTVSSRAGRFGMPSAHHPALDLLRAGGPVSVGELTRAAGVDQEQGLMLARTLVRRGVATVLPAVGDTGEHG